MSLLSTAAILVGCSNEQPKAFANDSELQKVLENLTTVEVPSKTQLVAPRERALVTIVSLTVQQSGTLLAQEVSQILDQKTLSPEEILEAVYQCAPYSGISRAADAAAVVNSVFKSKSISVQANRATTDGSSEDRFQKGVDAQIQLFGSRFEQIKQTGKDSVALANYFLATNCFGDYYTRKGLDLSTRELITMAMLVNLGTEPQLKAHIGANLAGGRTKEYLEQVIYTCLPFCGYPRMLNAQNCLKEVAESMEKAKQSSAQIKGTESVATAEKIFPRGEKNPYGKFFIGQSYLKMLNLEGAPTGNVTFEPGCRNKWHIHRGGGQLLIATAGEGWVQFEGKPAQKMHAGDVVYVPRDVKHWHGAAKDSWFTHLSVEVPDATSQNKTTEWLEDVSDEEYGKL